MHSILKFAETVYVEAQHLIPLLSDYVNPRDFLSRLVKSGDLIRLKNGFFVISEKIKKSPVPFEQIANLLYGPSYISLEWALSYYGMIPEGVYVVTSVSTGKTKSFNTPLGTFDYFHLSHTKYVTGLTQKENASGKFLIATPEKAVIDLVYFKNKYSSPKELLVDLIEGKRIDEETLKSLDKTHLMEIAEGYRSQVVAHLIQALSLL